MPITIIDNRDMDTIRVEKSGPLHGTIFVPGDKSITHRAILFGLLADGTTTVEGWLDAADCRSSISVARQLGAQIEINENVLHIYGTAGNLEEPSDVLDCGNSGTTIRMFTGALVGRVPFACLTGDHSLRKRPMKRIIQPLRQMGAEIQSRSNLCAPFSLTRAKITGMQYTLPVASAQVKSAVLIAGALAESGETTVIEHEPTRDHTENMLGAFGVQIHSMTQQDGSVAIHVQPNQTLYATHVDVPGDISSAAFLLAAGIIVPNSQIIVKKIGLNPTRTGFLSVLQRMGVKYQIHNERVQSGERIGDIEVHSTALTGTVIEGKEIPTLIDELPIISILASVANGDTLIQNAEELRFKETDRIHAIVDGLQRIGVQAEETKDGFLIHGTGKIRGGIVDSYHDHRIAMSFAIAGLISEQPIDVQNWSCVNISFPTFLSTLTGLQ